MDAKQRVEIELQELTEKIDNLGALLRGDKPDFISDVQWELLINQEFHMLEYQYFLQERLKNW